VARAAHLMTRPAVVLMHAAAARMQQEVLVTQSESRHSDPGKDGGTQRRLLANLSGMLKLSGMHGKLSWDSKCS
jgi:hypothetical protein